LTEVGAAGGRHVRRPIELGTCIPDTMSSVREKIAEAFHLQRERTIRCRRHGDRVTPADMPLR
jgi:hypothetical protein